MAKPIVFRFAQLWMLMVTVGVISIPCSADVSRPDKAGVPTVVHISMSVFDVDAINTAEQNYTANVYFIARWRDLRLKHKGSAEISRGLNEVWHPRLQFINQQLLWPTLPQIVEIKPNGEVIYRQRVWGSFSQALELHHFPFDKHTFSIILVAAGYTPQEVQLVLDSDRKSGLASEFSLADWTILDWKAESKDYLPLPGAETVAGFVLQFEAARHIGYFIIKVILPLIFVVMMSWIVFWIDPKESGAQISVSITTMLTLIAYRFMVGALLPQVSYLTRLDFFILGSTILVFATLVEVTITSILAKNERLQLARAIDLYSRYAFTSAFVAVFVIGFLL